MWRILQSIVLRSLTSEPNSNNLLLYNPTPPSSLLRLQDCVGNALGSTRAWGVWGGGRRDCNGPTIKKNYFLQKSQQAKSRTPLSLQTFRKRRGLSTATVSLILAAKVGRRRESSSTTPFTFSDFHFHTRPVPQLLKSYVYLLWYPYRTYTSEPISEALCLTAEANS